MLVSALVFGADKYPISFTSFLFLATFPLLISYLLSFPFYPYPVKPLLLFAVTPFIITYSAISFRLTLYTVLLLCASAPAIESNITFNRRIVRFYLNSKIAVMIPCASNNTGVNQKKNFRKPRS